MLNIKARLSCCLFFATSKMDSHRCYHGVNLNTFGMVTWSFFFLFIYFFRGWRGRIVWQQSPEYACLTLLITLYKCIGKYHIVF